MERTKGKKHFGGTILSWIYLFCTIAVLVLTVKMCCPALYAKAEAAIGLDENGRTAQAFSVLTERLTQGEFKEAFSESYALIRGNED